MTGSDHEMKPRDLQRLRQAYRPPAVRILFVGESPPAGGSFFYFGNSHLVRYTREAFTRVHGEYEGMDQFLAAFRDQGCYLVDLCQTPVNHLEKRERQAARRAAVGELANVLRQLRPARIVAVMKAIEPEVRKAAIQADLADTPLAVLPFPAQGNQRRYVEQLTELLRQLVIEEWPP